MKPLNRVIYLSLFFAASCGAPETAENTAQPAAAEPTKELVKVVNVKAESLKPVEFVNYYTVIGAVKANRDVVLSAEASGRIVRLFKKEGERVRAGEAIAKIDDTLLKAEMERMLAIDRQSKENFERIGRLWNDEKVGSEMEFLNSKYAYEQSTASMAAMNEQLERTVLKAPFDGIVDNIIADIGASVGMGSPMVRLIQDDMMKVGGGVPARFASDVKPGDPVTVEVKNGKVLTYSGTVNYVSSVIDPKSRTFIIDVVIPNNNHYLKVDAEASVTIQTERIPNAIVLDQEFIGRNEDGNIVFVVEEQDGKTIARARLVELGPTSKNNTVILKGLSPKDLVITEGFTYVEDRMRIRVVPSAVASKN